MKITPLKIGNLVIRTPLLLAPMAGYTRAPFRAICRSLGCGLVFTELVTAEGIVRQSPKTIEYLESFPQERPLAAHIYGSNPDSLAQAAQVIESLGRFDLIDVNCGCPVRKVTRKGAGVALMREPGKIRAIVQAVSQATSLPVTIKTRLGPSRELFNISQVAHAAEEGGASAIIIHARFATNKHSGPPDLETLERIKAERNVPVIGNGGIKNAADAARMIQQTGVDGVMVGRAAIGNPWIFQEIDCLWSGVPHSPPSIEERRTVIAEHLNQLYDLVLRQEQTRKHRERPPALTTYRKFRGHLAKYLAGMRGIRKLDEQLEAKPSIKAAMAAIDEILRAQAMENSV